MRVAKQVAEAAGILDIQISITHAAETAMAGGACQTADLMSLSVLL